MTSKIVSLLQLEVADEPERPHESDMIGRQLAKTYLVLVHPVPPVCSRTLAGSDEPCTLAAQLQSSLLTTGLMERAP
jgi:hypothetical protein